MAIDNEHYGEMAECHMIKVLPEKIIYLKICWCLWTNFSRFFCFEIGMSVES